MSERTGLSGESMSERSQDIGEVMTALGVAQLDFKEVKPTRTGKVLRRGSWVEYKYADLADCIRATREALAKYGLTVAQPRMLTDNGENVVMTILCHGKSGQYLCGQSMMVPSDAFNPQAIGTTVTYDRRYSYSSMVGLYVEGEDNDAEQPEKKNGSEKTRVLNLGSAVVAWINKIDASNDYDEFSATWDQVPSDVKNSEGWKSRVPGWKERFSPVPATEG